MKKRKILTRILQAGGVVAPFGALAVLACGNSKINLNFSIDTEDFELTGAAGSGKIELKKDNVWVEQLEVRYYVGATMPTSDNSYTADAPSNLKNGDVLYAKLFLKSVFNKTHTFKADAAIKIEIAGLAKIALSDTLTSADFNITGATGSGTIALKTTTNLNVALEIGYFKGATAPTDDASYSKTSLSNLANGDKVWIKLFVKDDSNYQINFNAFSLEVSGLLVMLTDAITVSDFTISGTSAGSGSLTFSKSIASQLEVHYAKSATEPDASAFSATVPSALKNGDKVWIKLVVKTTNSTTHEIALNVISKDITGLTKVTLTDTIAASDYQITGSQGAGILSLKTSAPSINANAEVRYFKGASAPASDASYNKDIPINLNNGDKVWVKIFAKDETNYQLSFTAFSIDISGLTTKLTDIVTNSDFALSGASAGSGTLTLNKSLASQLEVQYATGEMRPASSDFSLTVPSNLENGNKVWIKLVVKTANSSTYSIAENMIVRDITGLSKTTITETITASDVTVSGADSQGIAGVSKTLNNKVEARFFKGTTAPTDDSNYTAELGFISNGDKIWTKLFIKAEFESSYQITFAAISKDITLTTKVLMDTLEIIHIEASGANQAGTLGLRTEFPLSDKLEVRYAKSATEPTDDTPYSTTISGLKNADQIYAKLFVKSSATGYSISATAKSFKVYFSLDDEQFANTSPGHIILSNDITAIPDRFAWVAFTQLKLESSFVLPPNVTSIGDDAFEGADINDCVNFFRFNKKLTSIGKAAFSFSKSNTTNGAFPTNFILPDSLIVGSANGIRRYLFRGRTLNPGFVIPPKVTELYSEDFNSSTLVLGFKIPLTVTSLNMIAFDNHILPEKTAWYNKDHIKISVPEIGAYVGNV